MKNSSEIIIKQVRLEGGFKRGGRIRVVECLRQLVPNGLASIRRVSILHLQIAVAHFTHALLVLFFEALLPQPEEENFVVTADDIRQRRRRVGRESRAAGRFDLTEVNNPDYDLNFLDFVVSNDGRCRSK